MTNTHVEAQDLTWLDQVVFQGETYNVINSTFDKDMEKIMLWLSPTDGFDPDKFIAVDPKFSFEKITKPFEL